MSNTGSARLNRLKRILSIEERKLDAMKLILRQAMEKLDSRKSECRILEQTFNKSLNQSTSTYTLDQLTLLAPWSNASQQKIQDALENITCLEKDNGKLLNAIQTQSAVIKGWVRLIKKLESQHQAELSKSEMVEATDRYLGQLPNALTE